MVSIILQETKAGRELRHTNEQRKHHTKRKAKRYAYARYQELYKKKPGVLAKYKREDISWLEDRAAALPPDAIHSFYTNLWGTSPSINIPFDRTMHADHHIPDKITGVITKKEFNNRFNRLKNGSAPGPDGITKKHITKLCAKEALRLFYNILLACRFQPSAWSTNRTILIPKQGNDLERIENYSPLTIGSILGRI
jgi:hypothetical protein